MLKQAKLKLKMLIFDDSGVAMAYTIVVFLVFFLFCVSVYAMAENIRQKIELQNACDAAAYSGAVVQADMLSRIAVLNRALSWTYLQTNKRQMDYLVGLWAVQVHDEHIKDKALVKDANTGCSAHTVMGVNYYASYHSNEVPYCIMMRQYEEKEENVKEQVTSSILTEQIDYGNTNMKLIMSEISSIRNDINSYIKNAVDKVWTRSGMSDGSSYHADKLLLLGGKNTTSRPDYFADVNEEDTFLAFSGSTASDMGNGQGIWWNLLGTNIIQRSYVTSGLTAQYQCYSEQWSCTGTTHTLDSVVPNEMRSVPLKVDYSSLKVAGTKLKPEFFGQGGSIVVAAKRPLTNPFSWMRGDSATRGLYAAFTPKGNHDMWAVSAARAGVRLKSNQGTSGHYVVQYPGDTASGYTNNIWNLCEEDWDAVLIPVSRAWNETTTGAWSGEITAEALLKEVKDKLNVQTAYKEKIGNWLVH